MIRRIRAFGDAAEGTREDIAATAAQVRTAAAAATIAFAAVAMVAVVALLIAAGTAGGRRD